MSGKRRRSGFTLIEVLIVVVIMAVLAATIIPQFSSSTKDAKESSVKFNLSTMRSQIELYKMHHSGKVPDITAFPELVQLTTPTDALGALGTVGDPAFPYGPYVQGSIPVNPISGKNKVTAAPGTGAPTPSAAGTGGWLYRNATGEIWIDDPVLYTQ